MQRDPEREAFERRENLITCPRQVIAEFRPLMKSATHGDGIIEEISSLVVDGGEVCGFAHGSIVDTMVDGVVTEESPDRGVSRT